MMSVAKQQGEKQKMYEAESEVDLAHISHRCGMGLHCILLAAQARTLHRGDYWYGLTTYTHAPPRAPPELEHKLYTNSNVHFRKVNRLQRKSYVRSNPWRPNDGSDSGRPIEETLINRPTSGEKGG